MEQLLIQHLTFSYEKEQPVLNDVSLKLPLHTSIIFSGPVGCGKTTLLKLIAGLLPKYGGNCSGKITVPHGQRIGMLFQDPAMQFTMDTPQHELEFTLENLQVPHEEIPKRVADALAFVGLEKLAQQRLAILSGGQLQRVALAVTIAMKAEIILLDEPFSNIDEANRQFLLHKLIQLQRSRGTTIIISDHDLHNYHPLIQFVVQFHNTKVELLSPQASARLLKNADTQHNDNLVTPIPPLAANTIVGLTNYAVTRNQAPLIKSTNLKISHNKVTLLTGPSGAGKSTFLKSLAKLIPYSGEITYRGKNIQKIFPRKYYSHVGLLFQETNHQFLTVTVDEELRLSLKNGQNPFFKDKSPKTILEMAGLPDIRQRVVYSLSGGQRKLIQNLVMLMMGQDLLLMDEPFAGLDYQSLQRLLTIIRDSRQQFPQTLLIVSHQLDHLNDLIDYHLNLENQQLSYQGGSHNESQS